MNPVIDTKAARYVDQLNRYSQCMAFLRQAEEFIQNSYDATMRLLNPIDGIELDDQIHGAMIDCVVAKHVERTSALHACLQAAFDYDQNPIEDNLWLLEQLIELVRK